MRSIIAIRGSLIWIYRSSLIFSFVLAVGCGSETSCFKRKQPAEPLHKPAKMAASASHPLFASQAPLKSNTTQSGVLGLNDVALLDNGLYRCKNGKKLKRIAKLPENKQLIVCLHGLSRRSSDFNAMIEKLEKAFPHARILALQSLNKDSNSQAKASSPSSTLSIRHQAELAFTEITGKNCRDKHVVIIGHSQGGLRGFTLVDRYSDLLKKANTVIEHLITIGTPWKGAPIFHHIKQVETFNEEFAKIALTLDAIQPNYSKAVRGYFFKKAPDVAEKHPKMYALLAPLAMKLKSIDGIKDLDPESDFIRNYIPSALRKVDLPITAIAGVLTDFSKLFDPFPSSISLQSLAELNATYAALIGGDPKCEHDMLLPVATQQAEGLSAKKFNRVKVYDTCHGNKVGVSVKRGLSELNNKQVIDEVVKLIDATFYTYKGEVSQEVSEKGAQVVPAA